jgi:hypothetical protein
MVGRWSILCSSLTNRMRKQVLPTPESPIIRILARWSYGSASIVLLNRLQFTVIMANTALIVTAIVISSIGAILLTILLPLSYSLVNLDQYALYHSNWSEQLSYDADFSESGRHFTGLTGELIKFPRTKNLIQFSTGYDGSPQGILKGGGNELQAWTKEGANVYIQASYYFSLTKENILKLYQEYGSNWLSFVVRLSFSALKATTCTFLTNDFVVNSQAVSAQMEKNLASAFTSNFSGAILLDSFQLMQISFDNDLDTAINNKLVQAFKTKSYALDQNITLTKKQTELDVLLIDNNVSLILANDGQARAVTYQYEQLGQRVLDMVGNMTTSYTSLKAQLPTTTATELWKYMYVTELRLTNDFSSFTFLDDTIQKTIDAN